MKHIFTLQPLTQKQKWWVVLFPLLVLVTLFCILMPSFNNSFFMIDDLSLFSMPQLTLPMGWKLLKVLFTPGFHIDYYPIRDLSYWVDIHVFSANMEGLNTNVQLMHNMVIFALSAGLLNYLVIALGGSGIGLWVPLVWALHPIHFESIVWISARKDLLAVLFALGFVILILKYFNKPSKIKLIFSFMFYLLSGLSKTSFSLLPFIFLVFLSKNRQLKIVIPTVVLCVIGLGEGVFQSWHYTYVNDMRFFYTTGYRVQASLIAMAKMFLGLVDLRQNIVDTENWGEWVNQNQGYLYWGIGFLCGGAVLSIWAAFKKNYQGLFWMFAFSVLYLPIASLIFPHRNFYSTRYFEAPFVCLVVGLSLALCRYKITQKKFVFVGILLFLTFTSIGFHESRNWQDQLSMMDKSVRLSPRSESLQYLRFLALAGIKQWGRTDQAQEQLIKNTGNYLLTTCNPSARPNNKNGDLCWSYWLGIMRGLKIGLRDEEQIRFLAAMDERVQSFIWPLRDYWLVQIEYFRRVLKKEPIADLLSREKDMFQYLPTPRMRLRVWYAECLIGNEEKAKERMSFYRKNSLVLLNRLNWVSVEDAMLEKYLNLNSTLSLRCRK